MADLLILLNPLDVSRRRRQHLADGTPLFAWIDEYEPSKGKCVRQVFVNGHALADRTYCTQPGDEVLVTFAPGAEAITLAAIEQLVLQAVVSMAIGFLLGKLFAPKQPAAGSSPQPSQVYGISTPKNAARLGQPIPVIYGAVVALPDFAAQPFTRYVANDQYLYALLCLGQGDHQVTEMLFGPTSAAVIPSDIIKWRVFLPFQHRSTFGVIEGQIEKFAENVVTSPAVADQELVPSNMGGVLTQSTWYWDARFAYESRNPDGLDLSNASSPAAKLAALPQSPAIGTTVLAHGESNGSTYVMVYYIATALPASQTPPPYALIPPPTYSGAGATKWVGPFETCKAGQHGSLLELDFVFPGGLYTGDASGNFSNRTVVVQIGFTLIDATGTALGAETIYQETFTAKDNTPQRFSMPHAVGTGRYRVRVSRVTDSDLKVTTSDRVLWTGLKFQLDAPPANTVVYGDVTLIAVTLKATNGVAADAASSMRFRCTRMLSPLGAGDTAPTVNPADAFVDILTAPYGGARPVNADELDQYELAQSSADWSTHNGFNAVFDQASTVWEALALSVQTVHASPLPVGSRMSLIHDRVQPVRAALFADENIVAGSLQVTQAFDTTGTPAGVRVNYRDAQSFSPLAVLAPIDAPDFATVDLFGCTSASVAAEHASLVQAKRSKQRSSLQFSTELEGRNVLPGDRIGVAAGMVAWAQSARVERVNGRTLTLSVALTWQIGLTHAVLLRDPTGTPERLVGVTQGATPYELVLPSLPATFTLVGAGEPLEATFLTFGVQNTEVTDWTVAKVTPNGATVTLECANYDPTIYAGAATFTRAPAIAERLPQ